MVTFTSTHEPGDNFTVGDTTVTYTIIDYKGRQVQKSFVVSVIFGKHFLFIYYILNQRGTILLINIFINY